MIFIVHLRPCCSENKGWIVSYGLEAEKVVTVRTIEKGYIKRDWPLMGQSQRLCAGRYFSSKDTVA